MQDIIHKNASQNLKFFDQVYREVAKIPEGKVMTYGRIAKILGTKDARKIGWALHANKNPQIPCYRVVNKDGCVADNYAFAGGWGEQKSRLLNEDVLFKDEKHVDLDIHLWNGLAK